MSVTKPSRLEQEMSKKTRKTIKQRRTMSRWASLRVTSNTALRIICIQSKVRFMGHISCNNTDRMQCCIHF